MAGVKGASGGRRIGAGRKPQSALLRALTGNPGHRGRVLPYAGSGEDPVVPPLAAVDPPMDLPSPARAVWVRLAPFAIANRTLTPATAVAFELLCRNVVLEAALAGDPETRGGANHRGLIQRVDAELAAFTLRPYGKPILEAEPAPVPANPLARFLHRPPG